MFMSVHNAAHNQATETCFASGNSKEKSRGEDFSFAPGVKVRSISTESRDFANEGGCLAMDKILPERRATLDGPNKISIEPAPTVVHLNVAGTTLAPPAVSLLGLYVFRCFDV
jgi:hypothetical protein